MEGSEKSGLGGGVGGQSVTPRPSVVAPEASAQAARSSAAGTAREGYLRGGRGLRRRPCVSRLRATDGQLSPADCGAHTGPGSEPSDVSREGRGCPA